MYKPDKKEIQSRLSKLPGKSLFAKTCRDNAKKDIDGVILMILSQAKDNYSLVESIIGKELLRDIQKL